MRHKVELDLSSGRFEIFSKNRTRIPQIRRICTEFLKKISENRPNPRDPRSLFFTKPN
jgi:hypothetical protein